MSNETLETATNLPEPTELSAKELMCILEREAPLFRERIESLRRSKLPSVDEYGRLKPVYFGL